MNSALALPRATATVAKPRRSKRPIVCRVTVLSPTKLAALRTAKALGHELRITFDGYSLTITTDAR